jgi:hypothetical protein
MTSASGNCDASHLLLPPNPQPTSRMRLGVVLPLKRNISWVNRSLAALKSAFHQPWRRGLAHVMCLFSGEQGRARHDGRRRRAAS